MAQNGAQRALRDGSVIGNTADLTQRGANHRARQAPADWPARRWVPERALL